MIYGQKNIYGINIKNLVWIQICNKNHYSHKTTTYFGVSYMDQITP